MPKSTKLKPRTSSLNAAKNRFLYAIERHGGRYTHAAKLAEVSLSDHEEWLRTDPKYRENYRQAIAEGERRLNQFVYSYASRGARMGCEFLQEWFLENMGEEALARIMNGGTPQAK